MKLAAFLFCLALNASFGFCQNYTPVIEWTKPVPADARLIVKSGYLFVPENRQNATGKKVKLPFYFIRRPNQHATKNINLYMVGGPGYSTTAGIDSIGYEFGYLKFGGTIMFGQRGTKGAQPCLECGEVDEAIRQSLRKGLNRDSLVVTAVRQCRDRLTAAKIDLSAYTTLESAEDINDLRIALKLDSLNLIGLSYSGGLMLTVARLHPEAVKTLILRSPLPGFVNYDEHALVNFNEALEQVFDNISADPGLQHYHNLKTQFHTYFKAITGKRFDIKYLEKGTMDSLTISYSKSDLLEIINNRLSNGEMTGTPAVINDIVNGKHAPYVRSLLDGYFAGNTARALGMRYSVFCSEQTDLSDFSLAKKQNAVLPWLSGYRYNNVSPAICACWKVKPEPADVKKPVFSSVPAIIVGGDLDPGCSLSYNRLIKRTIPNSQLLTRHNEGHGCGFKTGGVDYLELFLADPYQKLVSRSQDVVVE